MILSYLNLLCIYVLNRRVFQEKERTVLKKHLIHLFYINLLTNVRHFIHIMIIIKNLFTLICMQFHYLITHMHQQSVITPMEWFLHKVGDCSSKLLIRHKRTAPMSTADVVWIVTKPIFFMKTKKVSFYCNMPYRLFYEFSVLS